MVITKDVFMRYEGVRQSGICNMFDVNQVCNYSGLTKEQVVYIMKHYGELEEKHLNK